MPDAISFRLLLATLVGWQDQRQQEAMAYLIEENRILSGHMRGRIRHRVSRSSIARILNAQGVPPVPERPTSWQTFVQAHWGAIARRGLLHDRSLDVAGLGDLLHGVRDRPGLAARADRRIDAPSR